jgi:hypothetical protein
VPTRFAASLASEIALLLATPCHLASALWEPPTSWVKHRSRATKNSKEGAITETIDHQVNGLALFEHPRRWKRLQSVHSQAAVCSTSSFANRGGSQSLVWANSFQWEGCNDHVDVETLRNIYIVFQQRHYHKHVRFQTVQFGWLLFEPTVLDVKVAMIVSKFKHLV